MSERRADFWIEIETTNGRTRQDGWRPELRLPDFEPDLHWMVELTTSLSGSPVGVAFFNPQSLAHVAAHLVPSAAVELLEGNLLVARGKVVDPLEE